jgi:hypothetical protein
MSPWDTDPSVPVSLRPMEEAQFERIIDLLGRLWDPAKHPRDRRGRFIRTFSRLTYRPKGSSKRSPTFRGYAEAFDSDGNVMMKVTQVDEGYGYGLQPGDMVLVKQSEVSTSLVKALMDSAKLWEQDARGALRAAKTADDHELTMKAPDGTTISVGDGIRRAVELGLDEGSPDSNTNNKEAIELFRAAGEALDDEKARLAAMEGLSPEMDWRTIDDKEMRGILQTLDRGVGALATARHKLGDKQLPFAGQRGATRDKNQATMRLQRAQLDMQEAYEAGKQYLDLTGGAKRAVMRDMAPVSQESPRDKAFIDDSRTSARAIPQLARALDQKVRAGLTRMTGYRQGSMATLKDRWHYDSEGEVVTPGTVVNTTAGKGNSTRPAATMVVSRIGTRITDGEVVKYILARHHDRDLYPGKGFRDWEVSPAAITVADPSQYDERFKALSLEGEFASTLSSSFGRDRLEAMRRRYATADAKRTSPYYNGIPEELRRLQGADGSSIARGDWVADPNGGVGIVSWVSGTDDRVRVQYPQGQQEGVFIGKSLTRIHTTSDVAHAEYLPSRAEAAAAARAAGSEALAAIIEDPESGQAEIQTAMHTDQAFLDALPGFDEALDAREAVLSRGKAPDEALKAQLHSIDVLAAASAGEFRTDPLPEPQPPAPPSAEGVTDPPGSAGDQSSTVSADGTRTQTGSGAETGADGTPPAEVPAPPPPGPAGMGRKLHSDLSKALAELKGKKFSRPTVLALKGIQKRLQSLGEALDRRDFPAVVENLETIRRLANGGDVSRFLVGTRLQQIIRATPRLASNPDARAANIVEYLKDLHASKGEDAVFGPSADPTRTRPGGRSDAVDDGVPINADVAHDEVSKALLEGRTLFRNADGSSVDEGFAVLDHRSVQVFPQQPTAADLQAYLQDNPLPDGGILGYWRDPEDGGFRVAAYSLHGDRDSANARAAETETNQFVDISSGQVFNVSSATDEPSPTDKSSERSVEPAGDGAARVARRTAKQSTVLQRMLDSADVPDDVKDVVRSMMAGEALTPERTKVLDDFLQSSGDAPFDDGTGRLRSASKGVVQQLVDRVAEANGLERPRGYSSRNTALRRSSDVRTAVSLASGKDEKLLSLMETARAKVRQGDYDGAAADFRSAADRLDAGFPGSEKVSARARVHADRVERTAVGKGVPDSANRAVPSAPAEPELPPRDVSEYLRWTASDLRVVLRRNGFTDKQIEDSGNTRSDLMNLLADFDRGAAFPEGAAPTPTPTPTPAAPETTPTAPTPTAPTPTPAAPETVAPEPTKYSPLTRDELLAEAHRRGVSDAQILRALSAAKGRRKADATDEDVKRALEKVLTDVDDGSLVPELASESSADVPVEELLAEAVVIRDRIASGAMTPEDAVRGVELSKLLAERLGGPDAVREAMDAYGASSAAPGPRAVRGESRRPSEVTLTPTQDDVLAAVVQALADDPEWAGIASEVPDAPWGVWRTGDTDGLIAVLQEVADGGGFGNPDSDPVVSKAAAAIIEKLNRPRNSSAATLQNPQLAETFKGDGWEDLTPDQQRAIDRDVTEALAKEPMFDYREYRNAIVTRDPGSLERYAQAMIARFEREDAASSPTAPETTPAPAPEATADSLYKGLSPADRVDLLQKRGFPQSQIEEALASGGPDALVDMLIAHDAGELRPAPEAAPEPAPENPDYIDGKFSPGDPADRAARAAAIARSSNQLAPAEGQDSLRAFDGAGRLLYTTPHTDAEQQERFTSVRSLLDRVEEMLDVGGVDAWYWDEDNNRFVKSSIASVDIPSTGESWDTETVRELRAKRDLTAPPSSESAPSTPEPAPSPEPQAAPSAAPQKTKVAAGVYTVEYAGHRLQVERRWSTADNPTDEWMVLNLDDEGFPQGTPWDTFPRSLKGAIAMIKDHYDRDAEDAAYESSPGDSDLDNPPEVDLLQAGLPPADLPDPEPDVPEDPADEAPAEAASTGKTLGEVLQPSKDPFQRIDEMGDDEIAAMLGMGDDAGGTDEFDFGADAFDQDFIDDGQAGLLRAPATANEADAAMDSVSKFPPTDEQRVVTRLAMEFKNIVVRALAGSGKTSTLELIARASEKADPARRFLYVAFNKAIQLEAAKRMPGNTEARTADSLAWAAMPKGLTDKKEANTRNGSNRAAVVDTKAMAKYFGAKKMGNKSAEDIIRDAQRTVAKYMISDDDTVMGKHVTGATAGSAEGKEVLRIARAMWDDYTDERGNLPFTNSMATKIWALSRPDLRTAGRKGAQVLFWDEAQDINPVLARVLMDMAAVDPETGVSKMQIIVVGDENQAIYGFRGATDLLQQIKLDHDLPLTKSWRFGPQVAAVGNMFLDILDPERKKYRVEGGGPQGTIVATGTMIDAEAVLARSNGGAIAEIFAEIERGRSVGSTKRFVAMLREVADTIEWLKAGGGESYGKKLQEDLSQYRNWGELMQDFNDGKADQNIQKFVRISQNVTPDEMRQMARNLIVIDDPSRNDVPDADNLVTSNTGQVIGRGLKTSFKGGKPYDMKYWADDEGNLRIHGTPNGVPGGDRAFGVFKSALEARAKSLSSSSRAKYVNKAAAGGTGMDTPQGHIHLSNLSKEQMAEVLRWVADEYGPRDWTPPDPPDVVVVTAHLSKGLEWKMVRIADDFRGPEIDKATGKMIMPDAEELRLAYVAVTRAMEFLDPGALAWIFDYAFPDNLAIIGRESHEVKATPADLAATAAASADAEGTGTPEVEAFTPVDIGPKARGAAGAFEPVTRIDQLPIDGPLPRHVKRQLDKLPDSAKTFLNGFLRGKGAGIVFSEGGLEGALGHLDPEGPEATGADPRTIREVNGAYNTATGHIIISDLETGNDDSDFLHEVGHAVDYGVGEYLGGPAMSSHKAFVASYQELVAASRGADGSHPSVLDDYLMHSAAALEGENHNGSNGIRETFAQMYQFRQRAAALLGRSASPAQVNAAAVQAFMGEHLVGDFDRQRAANALIGMAKFVSAVEGQMDKAVADPKGGIPVAAKETAITRGSLLRAPGASGEINPGVSRSGILDGAPGSAMDGTNYKSLPPETRQALRRTLWDFGSQQRGRAKTLKGMRDNLLASLGVASPGELKYGMEWYAQARDFARRMGPGTGTERGWHLNAAVIAGTSPKTRWEANMVVADLVTSSLDPETSPTIDDAFLDTEVLSKGAKKSVRDALAEDTNVIKEVASRLDLPSDVNPSKAQVAAFLEEQFGARTADGGRPQLYQFASSGMRTALINAHSRVLQRREEAESGTGKFTGKGLTYTPMTSDGYPTNAKKHVNGVMSTQMSAVNGIYNYRGNEVDGVLMPEGFDPLPRTDEELYSNISRGLGGHKTRSFYNNIVTGGDSEHSVTIDTHMLDAMILGVPATRSGVFAAGKTEFLDQGQSAAEGRNGTYPIFQEATRMALSSLGEGWSMARAQAVSWLTTLSSSESSWVVNRGLSMHDPAAVVRNVLGAGHVPDADAIVEVRRTVKGYRKANTELDLRGVGFQFTADTYKDLGSALKDPWTQFNAGRTEDTTVSLTGGNYAGAAYIAATQRNDKIAREMIEGLFVKADKPGSDTADDGAEDSEDSPGTQKKKKKPQPKISLADVRSLRRIGQQMVSLDRILEPQYAGVRRRILDDYAAYRKSLGVPATMTQADIDDILRRARDVSLGNTVLPAVPAAPAAPEVSGAPAAPVAVGP